MNTKDLINAIAAGDAIEIENAFHAVMASKISERLSEARVEYSQKMFRAGINEKDKFKDVGAEPIKWQAQQQGPSEQYSESELDEMIAEVFTKDTTAGEAISDFVHSKDPRFAGKSKQKRKEMALAAYYAKQRE